MRTEVTPEQSSGVEPEVVQSTDENIAAKRSHALEATSIASGAIAGAIAGAAAGPMAAVAGSLIGTVVGAVAGVALGGEQRDATLKTSAEDDVIPPREAHFGDDDDDDDDNDGSDPDSEVTGEYEETPA